MVAVATQAAELLETGQATLPMVEVAEAIISEPIKTMKAVHVKAMGL